MPNNILSDISTETMAYTMYMPKNGRIINQSDAPTYCMLFMRKRRANMLILTVLLINAKLIISKIPAIVNNIISTVLKF